MSNRYGIYDVKCNSNVFSNALLEQSGMATGVAGDNDITYMAGGFHTYAKTDMGVWMDAVRHHVDALQEIRDSMAVDDPWSGGHGTQKEYYITSCVGFEPRDDEERDALLHDATMILREEKAILNSIVSGLVITPIEILSEADGAVVDEALELLSTAQVVQAALIQKNGREGDALYMSKIKRLRRVLPARMKKGIPGETGSYVQDELAALVKEIKPFLANPPA
jgi:hypothetical protein